MLAADAAFHLALDERRDGQRRTPNACLVLAPLGFRAQNVIPSWHHITTVDRDRHAWRMGKHETDRRASIEVELRHNRGKIVSGGAQAM